MAAGMRFSIFDPPPAFKALVLALILLTLGFFHFQKIHLATADLGRHIKNGEVFFKEGLAPFSRNHYSYTEPDFPVVTHHWGSGVIYYLIWLASGFVGISVFNSLLYMMTLFFFFKAAERLSDFNFAALITVLMMPLLAFRTEIRPEVFSYLLMGLYFYLLLSFRDGRLPFRVLLIIVPLQLLWVNLHLFFIMGPALIGVFWLESLMDPRRKEKRTKYVIIGCLTMLASLLSPFGIKGLLEPFIIMREYGYMLAENQSVIFMHRRFPENTAYLHFELMSLLALIFVAVSLIKSREKSLAPFVALLLFCTTLAWRAIRGIPVFAFVSLPVLSAFASSFSDLRAKRYGIIIAVALLSMSLLTRGHYYTPFRRTFGGGLFPGMERSAAFYKDSGIEGPIFNNYDIGGYLIFYLYGQEKVFVDNRPEAYSLDFFRKLYMPMQEDDHLWVEADRENDFNCIYFYRHDMTPHAQPFLIRRIHDPTWAPVFVDHYTLVLLKRNQKNREVIGRFELPQSLFHVTNN